VLSTGTCAAQPAKSAANTRTRKIPI
jgi:hypothetical protein